MTEPNLVNPLLETLTDEECQEIAFRGTVRLPMILEDQVRKTLGLVLVRALERIDHYGLYQSSDAVWDVIGELQSALALEHRKEDVDD